MVVRFVVRCLAVMAMVALLPALAQAQTTITGTIRDASGAVLPGVTVEAASPVLIEKVRSTVSDGTGGRDTEWINSITFSHDITERLGGYVELFTVVSNAAGADWQGQFDVGLTYAVNGNLQLDLGCNFGITRSAPDYQPFVGISRRF